jgi:hypothetical protein
MRVITEGRLKEYLASTSRKTSKDLLRVLIHECKELNEWQPIDENTPKDRMILVLFESGIVVSGHWDSKYNLFDTYLDVYVEERSGKITHWQELPEDPK